MSEALLLVLTGCSASGKTSLMELLAKKAGVSILATTTSRPPRPNDLAGDYRHIAHKDFLEKANRGDIVLVAFKNGYGYGIDREHLQSALQKGGVVVRSTTPDCVAEYQKLAGDKAVFAHIESPAADVCRARMLARGGMSLEEIEARIAEEAGWDSAMADLAASGVTVLMLKQCATPELLCEQALEILPVLAKNHR